MSKQVNKNMSDECLTISVPAAGARYFGLSPGRSYVMAAKGVIPTVRLGRRLVVPVAAMDRILAQAEKSDAK